MCYPCLRNPVPLDPGPNRGRGVGGGGALGGRRDGRPCNARQMASAIPSHSRNTSVFQTDEIDDVVPQLDLSPKLEARKATAAEFAPHECLGLGLAPAKVFGAPAMGGHRASLLILMHCL